MTSIFTAASGLFIKMVHGFAMLNKITTMAKYIFIEKRRGFTLLNMLLILRTSLFTVASCIVIK